MSSQFDSGRDRVDADLDTQCSAAFFQSDRDMVPDLQRSTAAGACHGQSGDAGSYSSVASRKMVRRRTGWSSLSRHLSINPPLRRGITFGSSTWSGR